MAGLNGLGLFAGYGKATLKEAMAVPHKHELAEWTQVECEGCAKAVISTSERDNANRTRTNDCATLFSTCCMASLLKLNNHYKRAVTTSAAAATPMAAVDAFGGGEAAHVDDHDPTPPLSEDTTDQQGSTKKPAGKTAQPPDPKKAKTGERVATSQ